MQHVLLVDVCDERACHNVLLTILHPHGLCCPHGHPLPACGATFNLFTGTCWPRCRHQCSTIVQIVQGIARGVPTTRLAEDLGVERKCVAQRRQHIEYLLAKRHGAHQHVQTSDEHNATIEPRSNRW